MTDGSTKSFYRNGKDSNNEFATSVSNISKVNFCPDVYSYSGKIFICTNEKYYYTSCSILRMMKFLKLESTLKRMNA